MNFTSENEGKTDKDKFLSLFLVVKTNKRKRSIKLACKEAEESEAIQKDIIVAGPQLKDKSKEKNKNRAKTKRNLPHKLTEFSYLLQRKALRMMKKYYKQMFEKSF
jgi:hypothetical protein